jgi:hypothetical protein
VSVSLAECCAGTDWEDLSAQRDAQRNAPLTAAQVTLCSHRTVLRQRLYGHIWKAAVYARAGPRKSGCPVCAGRTKPLRVRDAPMYDWNV